jgi:putative spermidine/putrescine transport system ATP-binding protein
MGYRNMITARVEQVETDPRRVCVVSGDLRLRGTADPAAGLRAGSEVVVAVRPEDIVLGRAGVNDVAALAEVVEYHGRELAVRARTEQGVVLHFRTEKPVAAGARVTLGAPEERVLVFPAERAAEVLDDAHG